MEVSSLREGISSSFIDARYEKVRIGKRVISQGVLIVLGIDEDGRREILTVEVANTETEESYSRVFRNLKERGLKGVRLVTLMSMKDFALLKMRYFQGVEWQRCQVH